MRARTVARLGAGWRAAPALVLLGACSGAQSMLATRGPSAERVAWLWWLMLALSGIATLVVAVMLAVPLLRREERVPRPGDDRRGTRWILLGGLALPLVLVLIVYVATLRVLAAERPAPSPDDLVIEVTGRQFWWHVAYPGATPAERAITANEIHIPTGRRVRLELTSLDVIHSFWVPSLAGKLDLIPGRTTTLWLQADSAGVMRGQCAEYCGIQHARMGLEVVAEPPERFASWLAHQRTAAAPPPDERARRGLEVMQGKCAVCHAVRGTPVLGGVAPDLTHLASRRTIAAAMLPNSRGHLAGWIANPQSLKPGSHMPTIDLSAEELQAVLHYLETLR